MFNKIKEFFFGKPVASAPEAPYKIETPPQPQVDAKASTQTKCGCGRSQSGFCVGLHKLTVDEWSVHKDNPERLARPPTKSKAKKAPVEKTATPRKPRTKKTTEK